jgi:membrane-associated phospholipid phosphatase
VLLYQLILLALIGAGDLGWEEKAVFAAGHVLFALSLVGMLWITRNLANPVFRFFRNFYPLVAMIFFYKEIGLLVHQFFDWTLDEWLFQTDNDLGRVGMSVWNFQQFYPPAPLLNEFFSFGYSFYFILIPLAAVVIYVKGTASEMRVFVFTITLTYFLHYFLFMFFPAESPRFFMPGLRESLRGYWVSDWLRGVVEKNAFAGGSFPSSHVAASVVCLAGLRHFGKWKPVVLFLTLAMFLGTIYGRYHYFIDVMAGLGVGLSCVYLGPWLERNWPWICHEGNPAHERTKKVLN